MRSMMTFQRALVNERALAGDEKTSEALELA